MTRILRPNLASEANLPDPDHFSLQMCLKSVQLAESTFSFILVEGFVSAKNLFAYSFNLYNISMVLELLSLWENMGKRVESIRVIIHDFLLELFDCMELYEFDITQNPRNLDRLSTYAHI